MKYFEPLSPEIEEAAAAAVDSAYKVHTALGPGLIESVYEACLAYELRKRSLQIQTQVDLPIIYDGITISSGLRPDVLIENTLLVEVKAVETIHPVHHAQVLTYLKLLNLRLGLLINFNVPVIRKGIKRVVL